MAIGAAVTAAKMRKKSPRKLSKTNNRKAAFNHLMAAGLGPLILSELRNKLLSM